MGQDNRSPVKAAIDIGSNSIKLRVARCSEGEISVLWDTTEICHLGRGFVEGRIPPETLENAARVVTGMVRCARDLGAEDIRLVGTMALRVARNAGEFRDRIRRSTGLDIRVISGEEEARYSWAGAVAGLPVLSGGGDVVMFDTGGGSTEFVFARSRPSGQEHVRDGQRGEIVRIQSVPVGAVTLTERFFHSDPIRRAELDAARAHVQGMLLEYGISASTGLPVVGLGGGIVAMASVKGGREPFVPVELHGMTLTQRDLTRQVRLYSVLTLEERRNVVGLPPSRADVILGSACIVLCALRALDAPSCTLSINGLRHGVLLEMFGEDVA